MKTSNNITIVMLSILILVNFINSEGTCNCDRKCPKVSQEPAKCNCNCEKFNNEINKENNEDYDDDGLNDIEDTEDNNDIKANQDDQDYAGSENNKSTVSSDGKTKRQATLPRRRRQNHILNMIPFHRVPVIMYNAVSQTLGPNRKIRQTQGTELTKFAKGLSKAIKTRHLSGFIGGLGMHAADVADHLADISKDVINENQRQTRSNEEYNIWGKLSDRMKLRSAGLFSVQKDDKNTDNSDKVHVPFRNIGATVRGLVELLPTERTKRYYYKHYKPLANEIKKGMNSKRFRRFLRNTYASDFFSIEKDPVQRSTTVRFQRPRMKRY